MAVAYNVTLFLLASLLCTVKKLQNTLYHQHWAAKVLRVYWFPVDKNVINHSM